MVKKKKEQQGEKMEEVRGERREYTKVEGLC